MEQHLYGGVGDCKHLSVNHIKPVCYRQNFLDVSASPLDYVVCVSDACFFKSIIEDLEENKKKNGKKYVWISNL